ncbi:MAG TPA: PepSY domain-containing protein [Polyangiaceae bacterium]
MKHVGPWLGVALAVTWASTAWAGSDVALEDVPPAVRATIEREIPQGTLLDLEWEPNARVPHYDVEYTREGIEWELEVGEDGRVLRHEPD